jgi:hypothetical protein
MVSRAGALCGGQVGRHGANQNPLYLAPINVAKCRNEGATAWPNLQLRIAQFSVLRYGLAAGFVAIALGTALLLQRYNFRNVADPLFLLAIAIAVWYAGTGPAILAVVLFGLADTYFFLEDPLTDGPNPGQKALARQQLCNYYATRNPTVSNNFVAESSAEQSPSRSAMLVQVRVSGLRSMLSEPSVYR